MSINPFSYGKPIDDPARFIGRSREIEQVYSRLLSAFESTSIVGERSMGKTSLLKILAHPEIYTKFGLNPQKYMFVYQDFLFLDENTMPTRFWQRVLRAIQRTIPTHPEIAAEIDLALKAETIDNYTLDDIFTLIDEAELYVILLLDEFENVTRNRNFDSDFFGGLRALAIHHSLALVTSSRHDLVQLTHSEQVRSSPFFNIFATVNLRPFSEQDAIELIDRYLAGSEVRFLLSELNIIFAVAGYHPYFLQTACHHLFAAYQQKLDDTARRRYLMDKTSSEAEPRFQDYWRNSTPPEQVLLTILAMRELEQKGSGDSLTGSFDTAFVRDHEQPTGGNSEEFLSDLERFYLRASQAMTDLERRSLVIKNQENSAYHLFSTEFCEWIAEEIASRRDDHLQVWADWLKDKASVNTLPAKLQELLAEVIRGLNSNYANILGNWLLEPSTAEASLRLMKTFISRYEHYKETRPQRDAAATMANEQAPVGDTPRSLFSMINQKLDNPEAEISPISDPLPDSSPQPQPQPRRISTGRTLTRKKNISPTALGGLIISGIITHLDLDSSDQDFVAGELKWLFSATDHLLKVYRREIGRDQPVAVSIPPDAERLVQANNNQLLSEISHDDIQSSADRAEKLLERLNTRLKKLDVFLDQEANWGLASKGDFELQKQIKEERLTIVRTVQEMAQLLYQIYGIHVTSTGQLVELLEE